MYLYLLSTYFWYVFLYEWIDQCCVFVSSVCCSSVLLQKLKPVFCIVRPAVASINSLTVICEKHQVLPMKNKDMWSSHSCMKTRMLRSGTLQTFEILSPDNRFWWWWSTDFGFYVSAAPFWDAPCSTGWDGSAPHRESHAAWWWRMSSTRKTKQYFESLKKKTSIKFTINVQRIFCTESLMSSSKLCVFSSYIAISQSFLMQTNLEVMTNITDFILY